MEDDYEPAVQHQRRVNPKIHDVIKKEVEKLLDAGLIYPTSDSPSVSPVHCVPKKGEITVVINDENELVPTILVTGWRVCIDYRYFQIPIDPKDQEKTTFTCPYGTFAYRRIPFGLCNATGTFQRCMMAIFHDMIEKTMEVFMDDFSVFENSFSKCLSNLEKMLKRIEVDKAKIDVIAKLPHPTTIKGIRSFLRHAGMHSSFSDHKEEINRSSHSKPFELMCDASDYAIGAVLGQRIEKHFRPIHYASKTMTEAESNYTTTEKEMLAVVKFSRIPFGVTPKVILIAWESFGEIKDALMDKQYRQEDIQELMSKLLEDVRNISEEFSEYINCPSWNRPLFYFDDDDDEYTVIWRRPKAITPDEPSEEPEDPLIMGEKELSTIPEKDKSSVEDLVPIPSGSKGVSDDICDNDHSDAESLLSQDIPITSPKIDFLSEEFAGEFAHIPPGMDEDEFDEEEVDCYDHDISSDDDSYENIEYVEASPLNLEYDSLEEENEDQEEKEFDLEDIFQIQDVILREKLLNVHRLITNIESLKNNSTPDHVFKFPSLVPISVTDSGSFFEESDTFLSHSDNSLPEFETFSDHTEETRSGRGLTSVVISDNSNDPLLELPEFESFHFDLDPSFPRPPPEPPDVEISLIIETDAPVINDFDELNEDECFDPGGGENNVEVNDSFTFVTWIFLPFLTYPEVSPLLSSTRNEDTIFDPGIST
ncbi:reverse transcriptase domain-containing protein [Tanacetum coccineum]